MELENILTASVHTPYREVRRRGVTVHAPDVDGAFSKCRVMRDCTIIIYISILYNNMVCYI